MSSSRLALIALVAVNAVPLFGVLALGWSLFDIMLLYWLENGIIGLFTVLRMLASAPRDTTVASGVIQKLGSVPFFIVHYGIFWVVHGAFVFILFAGGGPFGGRGIFDSGFGVGPSFGSGFPPFAMPQFALRLVTTETGFGLAALSMVASHGVSYVTNFLGRGEFRRLGVQELMFQPYRRVIVLHVAVLFGGFAVMLLGAPILALFLLIGLKTGADIRAHLNEHQDPPKTRSATPDPTTP